MMKALKFSGLVFAAFLFVMFAFPKASYAYLDPGSGSYIFQMLVAGGLAALFAVKTFWNNIKLFFLSRFSKKSNEEDPA